MVSNVRQVPAVLAECSEGRVDKSKSEEESHALRLARGDEDGVYSENNYGTGMAEESGTEPQKWNFRRLIDDDLPLLHRWLNEPGVVKFWEGDDVSWPAVVSDYGSPALRSTLATDHPDFDYDAAESDYDAEHIEVYLAAYADEPTGWIQCYSVQDYDDEQEVQDWLKLGFDETGAGIDYLIGDPSARGKGLGSEMIRTFIDVIVFDRHPDWTRAGASPQRSNVASCAALATAGLSLVGSFDDDLGPCDLYATHRDDRAAL